MKFDASQADDGTVWIGKILHEMDVRSMRAELSGGGDSGDLDGISYVGEDGKHLSSIDIEAGLSDIKPPFTNAGRGKVTALEYLQDLVIEEATRAGNWYDNEGGHVESEYNITAAGMETEYVHLTHFEPDYDDDEYDEDEYDDDDPDVEDGMQP
ncbi:MAG: hypothetical protein ABJN42_29765 [Roseibium sp.]|uniref:hypothetical protein n=1 Tax=Roseibium sp. TaxID=1936156 RepID=UPI0032987DCD